MSFSFASNFQYAGVPRLGYFWANPNHAAAVLVTLLPIFWVLRFYTKPVGWRLALYGALLALEVLWSLMIGWTCSRGALVAWTAALVAFFVVVKAPESASRKQQITFWLCSGLVLAGTLMLTNVGARMADIAEGDRSALNRLQIWADGLRLIHAAPLTGWGTGNSGNALVHWFEPVDSTKDYAAVVSTYLHFTAELGLPALAGVLTLLGFTFLVSRRCAAHGHAAPRMIAAAAATGLVAFCIAALFSTLWVNVSVIPVLGVCAAATWIVGVRCRLLELRSFLFSFGGALVVTATVYLSGKAVSASDQLHIAKRDDAVIVSKNRAHAGNREAVLLVDHLVLGTFYGRTIRNLLPQVEGWETLHVYTRPPPTPLLARADVVICGPHATQVLLPEGAQAKAVFLNPVGRRRTHHDAVPRQIILPEYDEFGDASSWTTAFPDRVQILRETGQDCSLRVAELGKFLTAAYSSP